MTDHELLSALAGGDSTEAAVAAIEIDYENAKRRLAAQFPDFYNIPPKPEQEQTRHAADPSHPRPRHRARRWHGSRTTGSR